MTLIRLLFAGFSPVVWFYGWFIKNVNTTPKIGFLLALKMSTNIESKICLSIKTTQNRVLLLMLLRVLVVSNTLYLV